jgi:LysR family hydrogen peroxide-inducible transcriptional activator|tara:strand:- start:2602 stop:3456 length:855 start_codon:yes stop_codon:yes gene_type:complete
MPSFKNLQYLVALKKTNHFSNAAKECYVSASTFSAGIAKLENELQVKLVERDNKNVRFTSAGNRIAKQATTVLSELNVLVSSSKLDFFESEITIGIIPTISTYILPNFLSNLSGQYPKLKVSFREDTSENLLKQLDSASIDFAIFAFPYELPNYIESFQVFSDPIYLIQHKNRNSKNYENESVLMLEQGHCLRSHILQNNEILNQHISNFSCTSISTLVAMVDSNIGVSFLPKMAIDFGILTHYPNINLEKGSTKAKREIGVIYRKNNQQEENIKKLAKLLIRD